MERNIAKQLRVLHSLSYAENGGAQVVVANLVKQDNQNNIRSFVSFWNTQKVIPSCMSEIDEAKFVYFQGSALIRIYNAIRFVKRNSIDILHSHTSLERRDMNIVSIITRCPHIAHIHTRMEVKGQFAKKAGVKKFIHWLVARCSKKTVIATSQLVKDEISRYDESVHPILIEPGIDFTKFGNLTKAEARNKLTFNIPEGKYLIGCPSRHEEKKGIEALIQAVSNVDNGYLIIVGVGSKRGDFEKLSYNLGLADRCQFIDRCEDMSAFYSACDIIVVPSEEESFGLVYLEAIASKRPVIASSIKQFDFAREYVHTFEVRNAKSLEKQLNEGITSLSRSELLQVDISQLEDKYSMQNASEKVRKLYDEILGTS